MLQRAFGRLAHEPKVNIMLLKFLRITTLFCFALIIWVIVQTFIVPNTTYAQEEINCTDVSEIPQLECEALVAIFNAYPEQYLPADWLMTSTPCSWTDVTCDAGHVVSLAVTENFPPIPPDEDPVNHLRENSDVLLPSEIGNLTALTTLSLVGYVNYPIGMYSAATRIVSLPQEIGNLAALTTLDLKDNDLVRLPPQIGELTALTVLDLSGNSLESLPPEFGNLSSLETLSLSENYELTNLPAEFGNLSMLKTLDLAGPYLESLPPEFGNLSSLETLDLASIKLTSLPPEFGNLSSLKTLELAGAGLTGLPPEFGNLSSLEILRFNADDPLGSDFDFIPAPSHPLKSLPDEFGNLSSLRELDLSHGKLTELPNGFGNLSSLEILRLNGNRLTSLPAEIGNLTNLKILNVGPGLAYTVVSIRTPLPVCFTRLTSIPAEIVNLTSLEWLDLSCSLLESLPEGFEDFPDSFKQLIEGAGIVIANFTSRLPFMAQ